MKISIIGAGNVGGMAAERVAAEGLGEIRLIDIAPKLAQAKACDMDDSRYILGRCSSVSGSEDISGIQGSDIVVVTAGLARKPGMTREDLLQKNCSILGGIAGEIRLHAPEAVVIVVTNPLDVMTYFMARKLGFARSRVFGMGVTLDASRFANLISEKLKADVTAIQPCVIGSHGESMVPLPRFTTVNGTSLDRLVSAGDLRELVSRTVNRGKEIVSLYGTGSAYYAPSAAICQLVKAVAHDSKATLGVSAFVNGEYGLTDICVGLPCVIGRNGAEKVVALDLNSQEQAQLKASADAIKELISLLKL